MVDIDTVYQKVLAFANKEQRGYVTPQEFNLFANQAQFEIFEQYFYDTNQFRRIPGNDTVYADVDDMLEEKLQIFENVDVNSTINTYSVSSGVSTLPDYIYRVSKVQSVIQYYGQQRTIDCEILNTKDFEAVKNATSVLAAKDITPVANIKQNKLSCWNGTSVFVASFITYFKKPSVVSWGYYVIGDKALYDSSTTKTTHFELHPSEESELVYKILKFAGVSMKRQDLSQAAQSAESIQNQQEKQ
jgi:hypothetical protein